MSDFHIVVFFNDYYTLIIAFLTKQIQNRYRHRRLPDSLFLDLVFAYIGLVGREVGA